MIIISTEWFEGSQNVIGGLPIRPTRTGRWSMRPPEEVKQARPRVDRKGRIKAAEAVLAGDQSLPYPSCFHCQQPAKKYLKAFLTWHQMEFPKTYVFGELLDLISQVDKDLPERKMVNED